MESEDESSDIGRLSHFVQIVWQQFLRLRGEHFVIPAGQGNSRRGNRRKVENKLVQVSDDWSIARCEANDQNLLTSNDFDMLEQNLSGRNMATPSRLTRGRSLVNDDDAEETLLMGGTEQTFINDNKDSELINTSENFRNNYNHESNLGDTQTVIWEESEPFSGLMDNNSDDTLLVPSERTQATFHNSPKDLSNDDLKGPEKPLGHGPTMTEYLRRKHCDRAEPHREKSPVNVESGMEENYFGPSTSTPYPSTTERSGRQISNIDEEINGGHKSEGDISRIYMRGSALDPRTSRNQEKLEMQRKCNKKETPSEMHDPVVVPELRHVLEWEYNDFIPEGNDIEQDEFRFGPKEHYSFGRHMNDPSPRPQEVSKRHRLENRTNYNMTDSVGSNMRTMNYEQKSRSEVQSDRKNCSPRISYQGGEVDSSSHLKRHETVQHASQDGGSYSPTPTPHPESQRTKAWGTQDMIWSEPGYADQEIQHGHQKHEVVYDKNSYFPNKGKRGAESRENETICNKDGQSLPENRQEITDISCKRAGCSHLDKGINIHLSVVQKDMKENAVQSLNKDIQGQRKSQCCCSSYKEITSHQMYSSKLDDVGKEQEKRSGCDLIITPGSSYTKGDRQVARFNHTLSDLITGLFLMRKYSGKRSLRMIGEAKQRLNLAATERRYTRRERNLGFALRMIDEQLHEVLSVISRHLELAGGCGMMKDDVRRALCLLRGMIQEVADLALKVGTSHLSLHALNHVSNLLEKVLEEGALLDNTPPGSGPQENTTQGNPLEKNSQEGNPPAEKTLEGNPPAENTPHGNPPEENIPPGIPQEVNTTQVENTPLGIPPEENPTPGNSTEDNTPPNNPVEDIPQGNLLEENPPPGNTPEENPPPGNTSEENPPPGNTPEENPPPGNTSEENPPPGNTPEENPPPGNTSEENPPPGNTPEENPPPGNTSEENPPPGNTSEENLPKESLPPVKYPSENHQNQDSMWGNLLLENPPLERPLFENAPIVNPKLESSPPADPILIEPLFTQTTERPAESGVTGAPEIDFLTALEESIIRDDSSPHTLARQGLAGLLPFIKETKILPTNADDLHIHISDTIQSLESYKLEGRNNEVVDKSEQVPEQKNKRRKLINRDCDGELTELPQMRYVTKRYRDTVESSPEPLHVLYPKRPARGPYGKVYDMTVRTLGAMLSLMLLLLASRNHVYTLNDILEKDILNSFDLTHTGAPTQ